jgi:hypothetical protein
MNSDFNFSDYLVDLDEGSLALPAGSSEPTPPARFSGTGNPYSSDFASTSLEYQPIFNNQSVASFGSNDTGRTGMAVPSTSSSLSVPEAFAAQLSMLDLSSSLFPVLRTLCSFTPPPLTHSQDSFCRKFQVWRRHLSYILDLAVILLFHLEKVVPVDDKDGNLTALMVKYTPRAVFFIIAGDVHNGGSFGVDGAGKHIIGPIYICLTFFCDGTAGLYFMPCIVQWAVDNFVAVSTKVKRFGRGQVAFYGMIPLCYDQAEAVNTNTFHTLTDEWAFLNEQGSEVSFLLYIRFTPDVSIYRLAPLLIQFLGACSASVSMKNLIASTAR